MAAFNKMPAVSAVGALCGLGERKSMRRYRMVMGTMYRTLQSAAFAKTIQEHAQADVDIVLQWGFDETLQWAARGRSVDVARGCSARIHKLQSEQHKKLLATRGAIKNAYRP